MYYLQIDESVNAGDITIIHFATKAMADEYATAYLRRGLVENHGYTKEAVNKMNYAEALEAWQEFDNASSGTPSIYIAKVVVNSEKSIGRHVFNAMRDGFMARLKGFDFSKTF